MQGNGFMDTLKRVPDFGLLVRREQNDEQGFMTIQHGETGEIVIAFQQKPEHAYALGSQRHQKTPAVGRSGQGKRATLFFHVPSLP